MYPSPWYQGPGYPGTGYPTVCDPSQHGYQLCYHVTGDGNPGNVKERRSMMYPRFYKIKKRPGSSSFRDKNEEIIKNFGRVI